jgi:hypothetical protein
LQVTEIYLLVILAVISVYWSPSPRYLVCLMPIYVVYLFEGFRALVARLPRGFARPVQVAAAALVLLAPAVNAVTLHFDPNDTLVTAASYEELCGAVRHQTASDALVIFWNPRVLALSTGRHASGWPAAGPPERMADYLRRVEPDYIVADKSRLEDRQYLVPVFAAAPLRMATVYENGQFILVRVLEDRDGSRSK